MKGYIHHRMLPKGGSAATAFWWIAVWVQCMGVSMAQLVSNGRCEDALTLPTDGSTTVATMGMNATYPIVRADDFQRLNACKERSGINLGYEMPIRESNDPNVWYTFNGTGNGMRITACSENVYDMAVTVFGVPSSPDCTYCCATLDCAAVSADRIDDFDCAQTTFSTVQDRIYYVMVTGAAYNESDTTFTLQATELNNNSTLAPNDLCENATPLTVETGKFTALLGYNQAKHDLSEYVELNCYGPRDTLDHLEGVFYTVTAKQNGLIRISACNFYLQASISVYYGGGVIPGETFDLKEECSVLGQCQGRAIRETAGASGRSCDALYSVEWDAFQDIVYIVWVRSTDSITAAEREVVLLIESAASTPLVFRSCGIMLTAIVSFVIALAFV